MGNRLRPSSLVQILRVKTMSKQALHLKRYKENLALYLGEHRPVADHAVLVRHYRKQLLKHIMGKAKHGIRGRPSGNWDFPSTATTPTAAGERNLLLAKEELRLEGGKQKAET